MFKLRLVESSDKEFWYSLDRHLPDKEFERKIRDGMGYIIMADEKPIGVLRYNLFWDNIPFLTLIFIDWPYQKKGFGFKAVDFWEKEMKKSGYGMILLSTQVDEEAQHFYRKLGYKDCGCLVVDTPKYEQTMEMFMAKAL
jgi:GNAT superfamily N-acetyltransferase